MVNVRLPMKKKTLFKKQHNEKSRKRKELIIITDSLNLFDKTNEER